MNSQRRSRAINLKGKGGESDNELSDTNKKVMQPTLTQRNADLSSSAEELEMDDSSNSVSLPRNKNRDGLAHFGTDMDGPDYRDMC